MSILSDTCITTALPILGVTAIVAGVTFLAQQCRKKKKQFAIDTEKQVLTMTTPGETPAGPPPMAWQADYGLVPQMDAPPPYMAMGGVGGMMGMPGMMGGIWPGAMNAYGGMGEPKPQYLPPGPMPYGGLGMGMMGGYGGGMMPYGGYGCPPPIGTPGVELRGPKGFCTVNLLRLQGSSERQRNRLLAMLAEGSTVGGFDFECWQFPASDNVGEFLEHVGANKDRYRVTEIREIGNGGWGRGLTVKWADEPGRLRRLESIGWGSKAGTGQARPVFAVMWKKPEA